MFRANVLDAKIVHDQCETDGLPFVLPEARGGIKLVVPCLIEVFFEEFVG